MFYSDFSSSSNDELFFSYSTEEQDLSFINILQHEYPLSSEISNHSSDKTTNSDLIRKKRGRKKTTFNNNRPEHNKFAKDNIKRKIQVHYLKFLINFINQIIDEISEKDKNIKNFHFYNLDYKFAKAITKKSFNILKNSKIGDIFKDNVSPKFKNFEILNVNVYNEVAKNITIKDILNKKYLEFFNIYYLNKKKYIIQNFDHDKTINLSSNLGFFEDLIRNQNKEKDINSNNDDKYIKKIKKCIEKDFLLSPIFVVKNNSKIDVAY